MGKLRTEIAGSAEHAKELEGELEASHEHRKALEERLHALEAAAKHVAPHHVLPRAGIDYAWHPEVNWSGEAPALRRAGVTFALRYLGPTPGEGKALSAGEARALSAAGIDLGSIYETDGQTTGGFDRGVNDARKAQAWAHELGMPADRPIYFTADFDAAGEGRVGEVAEYVRGAVSVRGYHGVGLYGGLAAIEHCFSEHRCAYLYQTLAWSDGRWSPHAQLRQVRNGRRVVDIDCDLDTAYAADFGQWRI